MYKIEVKRGPGTECNGFCNAFDPLYTVFAQSFALGAAMCTLLGNPGPSELTLEVKQEHENTTDNRDSTDSERESQSHSQTRATSYAKSSSQMPEQLGCIAPSRTPQNPSADSPLSCVYAPDSGKQAPPLRSGEESSPKHPEGRGLTEPSSSANTLHNDLQLVLPSFDSDSDSGTAANSGGADSAQCTAKAADGNCTEQCHVDVLVSGHYPSGVDNDSVPSPGLPTPGHPEARSVARGDPPEGEAVWQPCDDSVPCSKQHPVNAGQDGADSKGHAESLNNGVHIIPESCASAVSRKGARKRESFPCATCRRRFSKKFLGEHQALCTPSPEELAAKFCCQICGRVCDTRRGLSVHMSGFHKILKSKECNICGETFVNWGLVIKHKLAAHQVKQHSCHICGKTYTEKYILNAHLAVHSGVRQHICEFCGKGFFRYPSLCNHKVMAHNAGKVVLQCQHCDKTFSTKWCLNAHLEKNHSTGPYFERSKKRIKHPESEAQMLAHRQQQVVRQQTKRWDISCVMCGRTFAFPCMLKRHYESHNERLFQCSVCPKKFRSHHCVTEHERVHSEESKLQCEICGRCISHLGNFRRHMRKHQHP